MASPRSVWFCRPTSALSRATSASSPNSCTRASRSSVSLFRLIWQSLIEDIIRGLSGPLGVRARRAYYRRRLFACGARLVIEPGVHLIAPEWISLGDDVWIDRFAVMIAGPPAPGAQVSLRKAE